MFLIFLNPKSLRPTFYPKTIPINILRKGLFEFSINAARGLFYPKFNIHLKFSEGLRLEKKEIEKEI